MNLQDYVQVMRPTVEKQLRAFIDNSIPSDYPELRAMLAYHMGWEGEGAGPEAGGKRIRPLLVLLCAEAAGGCWQDALPAAVSVELLHNFSLIHDDIQDNSPLRRGRPTVWVKWGQAQAINAGDVMFTLAFLAIQDLAATLDPQQVLLANRILQQTCLRLTQGQYLDISYETRPSLPVEAYWPMIGGKTSELLACCCELGALAARAGRDRAERFRSFGYNLGLAFQVLDDWLGIWGDAALTGKSVESDLATGKKTLPVLYGLQQGGEFARLWMQGKIAPKDVPTAVRLLEAAGAKTHTLETAERLTASALEALGQAAVEGPAAQALHEMTRTLLRRKN
ncbi:MAG: polyprenyl synthetase family protein [Chloroflexi bacterium]|nr:polyprenyl synthetase family protein [Chloroflexota bacterium]